MEMEIREKKTPLPSHGVMKIDFLFSNWMHCVIAMNKFNNTLLRSPIHLSLPPSTACIHLMCYRLISKCCCRLLCAWSAWVHSTIQFWYKTKYVHMYGIHGFDRSRWDGRNSNNRAMTTFAALVLWCSVVDMEHQRSESIEYINNSFVRQYIYWRTHSIRHRQRHIYLLNTSPFLLNHIALNQSRPRKNSDQVQRSRAKRIPNAKCCRKSHAVNWILPRTRQCENENGMHEKQRSNGLVDHVPTREIHS